MTPTTLLGLMPRADTGELAPDHEALFTQTGLRLLTADDVTELLRDTLLAAPTDLTAASVELDRYVRLCQELAPRAFLSEFATVPRPVGGLAAELRRLSDAARYDRMLDQVTAVVEDAVGMSAGELDPAQGFFDLGMDSVMSLRVRDLLEESLGLELSSTLTFEHATATQLTEHLLAELAADGPEPPSPPADRPPAAVAAVTADADDVLRELEAAMAAAESHLDRVHDHGEAP
jgi:acyl carrier protein